ncbi:FAD-dependent monooxygenase [Amycolatopsis pigmentata]|uniref:FAD-dependent monooxygenase n=1 Tax=Amycolatopsis pigmentata TaxID=450801 RepID=A0ABW5G0Q6_9PSEU
MNTRAPRTILISGAGIAGPALAFWLHRHGFAVTVVEQSATVRTGGYPIDLRGTAVEVARRMGILPRLQDLHVRTRRLVALDADGSLVASLSSQVTDGDGHQHLEVRRGDLTETLYGLVEDTVEFVFNDSIHSLDEHADGVDVVFDSGVRRPFSLVIGADGLHSRTRGLVFGPEKDFHHYLGYCFAGFTMPNFLGLSHEAMLWSSPGKGAALYAVKDSDEVHGFLNFVRPDAPLEAFRDPEAQRELVAETFAGEGWEIPRMVAAMNQADDLFFDVVSQIRMPHWSSGRVSLIGDAGYATSFLTGQGTSLALVGAYMLAHALATHSDHTAAFAAYERDTRDFVTLNQGLVTEGKATMFPATPEALAERNAMLRRLDFLPTEMVRPEHSALTLPD